MYDYNASRRVSRAVIHLDNLRYNLDYVRGLIGPECRICLAVKADAYGHGAVAVAKAAIEHGVGSFAVSNVDEGTQLRQAGITAPILLLGYPGQEELEALIMQNLEPFAGDRNYLLKLDALVQKMGRPPLKIHIKVDTGMGRLGCRPEEMPSLAAFTAGAKGLCFEGLCTHFPCADSNAPEDVDFTRGQIAALKKLREELVKMGLAPALIHGANSGGIFNHRESHLDMVRLGLAAYGYAPEGRGSQSALRPVMELKSRIAYVKAVHAGESISYGRTWISPRESRIATIPIGYADGCFRSLSGKGEVLIRGQRYPVAGRICMDQMMVDLGPDSSLAAGEDVSLFGPDPQGPDAAELAGLAGTIPYEITCAVSRRVPRVYKDAKP